MSDFSEPIVQYELIISGVCEKMTLLNKEQIQILLPRLCSGTNYTHHQKAVILDTAGDREDYPRRVTAYMGGIDLTSGRYDNAEHSIFGTLDTTHSADFHQACIAGAVQACGGERAEHKQHHCVHHCDLSVDLLRIQ